MSIGVALIGSGIFATENHLPAIQACPLLRLKAIYSRTPASALALAAKASSPIDVYSDHLGSTHTYHDLLLRPDIAAVIIALPIPAQPAYIEAALDAGKHVLSEKPVAENVARAERLIEYCARNAKEGATWSVAENFRFLNTFGFAKGEVGRLGRVLGFRVKVFANVKPGTKYFETAWRKDPRHQGGFLLDGGVHFTAGTRLLLGPENAPVSLSAYSCLLQSHLPPVDTVNSIWKTKTGVSGTVTISFGNTLSGDEYTVACENGSVSVSRDKVVVREGEEREGRETVYELKDSSAGVAPEVAAWAEGIMAGKPNPEQAPEKALADLELLEGMLRSGERDGERIVLTKQI